MGDIVLSGATGLVGRRLLEQLDNDGESVRALTRAPERSGLPASVKVHGWDGLRIPREVLAGAGAVVHLAGESVFGGVPTRRRRQRMRDSRIESTRHIVRVMADLPRDDRPRTFVCASAVGYYGDRGEQLLDEGAAAGAGFLAELCVDWENAALAAERHGVRVVSVRIGVVLSDRGGALPMMARPFRMGVGGRLGSGRQWFPWIHLDDLVGLLRATLVNDRYQGPVNAVAPENVTNAGLTRALGGVLGRPTALPVPAFPIRALLGPLADELLGSKRVVPGAAQRNGFEFRWPKLEPTLADLLR